MKNNTIFKNVLLCTISTFTLISNFSLNVFADVKDQSRIEIKAKKVCEEKSNRSRKRNTKKVETKVEMIDNNFIEDAIHRLDLERKRNRQLIKQPTSTMQSILNDPVLRQELIDKNIITVLNFNE